MNDDLGQASWEQRWSRALTEHGDVLASRPPNGHLLAEVGDLAPGRALGAGCGHGAETLWLAASGQRQVTVEDAREALDDTAWRVVVAEERRRAEPGGGVDAVVRVVCQLQ